MAGVARSPSEAIFAPVRDALDVSEHDAAGFRCGLFDRPIVITNKAYRFMVLEQLAEIGLEADVLLEPMRRDSGPAIGAARHLRRRATGRSCSRLRRITSSATPPLLSSRARAWSGERGANR